MTLGDFQKQHGPGWRKIVENPAFQAGLQYLHNKKLEYIESIPESIVDAYSKEILGGLISFFQHERELMTLHSQQDFRIPEQGETEYISPEDAAEEEALGKKLRKKKQ